MNSWNKLPEEVISAKTANTFKNRLDKHNLLYLNVISFRTSLFSGRVFFQACATFGVLAENSVVL